MYIKKIMVVEDETIIALDIKNRLESIGYVVCAIVPSGEEALRIIEDVKPDLVLMDIVLRGDMDGMQTAESISTENKIPVVFLTSYSDEKTLQLAHKISPYGYLVKPFNENDLKTKLENVKKME
jgi:two-component system, response regulator PdtaR